MDNPIDELEIELRQHVRNCRQTRVYLIGALKNERIPHIAAELRKHDLWVFDEWWTPGEFADSNWQKYERIRGRSYKDALQGEAAKHIFAFDFKFLSEADVAVLVAPAGKSAHLELGWFTGTGRLGYVLLDGEPERYDLMLQPPLVTAVVESVDELCSLLMNVEKR